MAIGIVYVIAPPTGALKMQDGKMQDLKMEDLLGMRRAFVVKGTEAGEHRADISKHERR